MVEPIVVTLELPSYLTKYLLKVYGPGTPIKFKHQSLYNRYLIRKAGIKPRVPTQITLKYRPTKIDVCVPFNLWKDPRVYNYLSREDQQALRLEIASDFKTDYVTFIKLKMKEGLTRKDSTLLFMFLYNISDRDYSFDAIYRHFSRMLNDRRLCYSESPL